MIGAVGATVKTRVALPVPPEFVALIVTFVVPGANGVPLMTPVLELTDNPAGSPLAEYEVGLFVPVIV